MSNSDVTKAHKKNGQKLFKKFFKNQLYCLFPKILLLGGPVFKITFCTKCSELISQKWGEREVAEAAPMGQF